MKVAIKVTLDIDPEAWAFEFGIDPEKVREDVQTYFADTCEQQLLRLGLGKESC